MVIKCPKCKSKLKDNGSHLHCNQCGYDGPKTKVTGWQASYPCPNCGSSFTEPVLGVSDLRVCLSCNKQYQK